MMKKVLLLLTAVTGLVINNATAQLTIVNNSNATQLAQLLAGNGVTISNAVKNCPNAALGSFSNGNTTNLGLGSGVVLTTGTVAPVSGAQANFASTDNTNGTDATLNAISAAPTQDVCVLEFDIVPQGNVLNFRYVFGSEEYPEYVCSGFNDVFGFFVSGPNPGGGNYTNTNIATIPNSTLPVAINTVNSGSPGGGYTPAGCQSLAYSQYYVDNTGGTFIVYDGFTTILNSTIGVVPCQTYHVKLAIGDAGDGVYDSGVFIEASSFVSQSSSVTASYPAGFTSAFEGCVNGTFTINVPNLATSSTAINYTLTGSGTNGTDYLPLSGTTYVNPGSSTALVYVDPVTDGLPEGTETVTLTIYDPCTGQPVASATINIQDKPADTAYATPSTVCVGGQVQLTATGGGTYSWTPTGGLSSPTSATPTATVTATTTYTAEITFGSCVSQRPVTIVVDSIAVDIIATSPIVCPGSVDTLFAAPDGGVSPLTYQWSPAGQVSDPNAQLVTTSPSSNTTYTVVVTDAAGCTATDNYTISVNNNLTLSLGPDVNVCPEDAPYTLSVPGGPYDSYSWSNGANTPTIVVTNTGSFSVTVTEGLCTYTSDTVDINFVTPVDPTLADAFFCSGSQATLSAGAGLTNILWNTNETTSTISVTTPGDYYYTADDANGCAVESDTATVTEIQSPAVNATATPDTICPGATSLLRSGAAQGLSYNWSNGANTSTTSVTVGGTYYLTVSDAVCSSYDTVTVYEYANPQPTVVADTIVCNGESVTFTLINGPFNSYTWSNGASGVTSITTSTPGQYHVSVNDGNCNWVSNDVTLSNFPTPVPTLADTGACLGNDITLAAENGLVNIVWNTQATTQTIIASQNGTFYYTAEDVNGCPVVSDTIDVTFQTPPSVNADASPDTICTGGSSTLTANAVGNNLTYLWTPTGATTDTVVVSQPGVYIVEVNDFFCPSFDTVEVFQYQFPPVSIGTDQTVCEGFSVILTASGGPYVSYNWSNGVTSATDTVSTPGTYSVTVDNGTCPLTSNTITLSNYPGSNPTLFDTTLCVGGTVMLSVPTGGYFDVLWSNGATTDTIYVTTSGNYSFTAATPNECPAASDTATVTFVNPPAVNATASPDSICAGGSSTLTANATGSNLTYFWSTQENTSSITVSQTGTYYLTVNDGSCTNYDTVTVYQHTHAPVVLNNDTIVCPGQSVTVTPSGSPYVSYAWSNNTSGATLSVSTPGSYWVTVNDGNCNYVSDTFTLSNFQPVNPLAFSDTNVCAGQPVTLTGQADYTNIVWSNQLTGLTITVTTAGTYSYTALDGTGCSVTSNTVTVTHRPYPNPNIVATPPAICVGQGTTTLNAGSEAGVTYVWQPTGAQTPTIQVGQPGTYSVQATLNGCVALDTLTVNAADTPVLNLQPLVLSCCQTVVVNPAPGQGYTYVWNTGSTDSTLTVTTTNNAIVNYTVTATNSAGCTSVGTTSVIIKCINAIASALPDTVMIGDSSLLNVTTDYVATFSYNWTPSGTLTGANTQNPTAAPTEETTYTVIVTDVEDGCADTAIVTLFVYGDTIAMPNAFTPNGDGKNDQFYPVFFGNNHQVVEFRVYNRWGALVHNSIDPWDGEFTGKGQPAGTYVYYIIVRLPDLQNQGKTIDKKMSGSFTLLR